jgi:hypothetical protein
MIPHGHLGFPLVVCAGIITLVLRADARYGMSVPSPISGSGLNLLDLGRARSGRSAARSVLFVSLLRMGS